MHLERQNICLIMLGVNDTYMTITNVQDYINVSIMYWAGNTLPNDMDPFALKATDGI